MFLKMIWAISAGNGTARFSKSFVRTERIFPALELSLPIAITTHSVLPDWFEAKNFNVFTHFIHKFNRY